jgi:hypothetical protein
VKYCRRCDLFFCVRHVDQHVGDDHELVDPPPQVYAFCGICYGVYSPAAVESD